MGYCGQDFSDSVFLMNNHLTKDAPKVTLFKPDDTWITNEKDSEPYILKHLDDIK